MSHRQHGPGLDQVGPFSPHVALIADTCFKLWLCE